LNPFSAVVVTITLPFAASIPQTHARVAQVLFVGVDGVGALRVPDDVGAIVSSTFTVLVTCIAAFP
jgi:hypothetical protein